MKKMNSLMKFAFLCIVLATVFTIGIAANTKEEAQAFEWFDRVSVNKCAISLPIDTFTWTGKPIKPDVKVNYKGTDLVKNVDYILSYQNNTEAGTGKVIIEGKGNYRGKTSINFQITGIDFKNECLVTINNGIVEVYYKGQLLKNEKDYWYTELKQALLIKSQPAGNGYLNTYKVTKYYTISGKNQFDGSVVKEIVTTETLYENITFTQED